MTSMEDPITEAQQRALSLLSEHHEPLSMSPGEVRQLLGRYRRGLSELTKAMGPLPAAITPSVPQTRLRCGSSGRNGRTFTRSRSVMAPGAPARSAAGLTSSPQIPLSA